MPLGLADPRKRFQCKLDLKIEQNPLYFIAIRITFNLGDGEK